MNKRAAGVTSTSAASFYVAAARCIGVEKERAWRHRRCAATMIITMKHLPLLIALLLPLLCPVLTDADDAVDQRVDPAVLRQQLQHEPLTSALEAIKGKFDRDDALPRLVRMQLATLAAVAELNEDRAVEAAALLTEHASDWLTALPERPLGQEGAQTVARELMIACQVYDALRITSNINEDQMVTVRNGLAAAATSLMRHREGHRRDSPREAIAAVGLFAVSFPDHPTSTAWLNHTVAAFDQELDDTSQPLTHDDAGLAAYTTFARALQEAGGGDFFRDERFIAIFQTLVRMQSSADGAEMIALLPARGVDAWGNIAAVCFARAAAGFAHSNRSFAQRLMWAWHRAGAPCVDDTGLLNLMSMFEIDLTIKAAAQPGFTSESLPNGWAVLRQAAGTPHEGMLLLPLAVPSDPSRDSSIIHGSISLHALTAPLVLTGSVPSGSDPAAAWRRTAPAHNRIVFDNTAPTQQGIIEHAVFDHDASYLSVDLSTPDRRVVHRRRIITLQPHIYVIWDDVARGANAMYHLHVLGEQPGISSEAGVDRLRFGCVNDVTLDLFILWPRQAHERELVRGSIDPHPLTMRVQRDGFETETIEATSIWLQLQQAVPNDDFVTVLTAGRLNIAPAVVHPLAAPVNAHAMRITHAAGDDRLYLNPQHSDTIRATAVASLVQTRDNTVRRIAMFDGVALAVPDIAAITTSTATSLALRIDDPGRSYRLHHQGSQSVTITLTLPWTHLNNPRRIHRIRQGVATQIDTPVDAPAVELDAEPGDVFVMQQ